ncbi:MAG TPA: UDP-3-O-acyl-N-acetylglucosamine deacetylase [bacterium]|nr:UDP-3-O-acyl-N-acetylglucosamine deacetylase [bacterium]
MTRRTIREPFTLDGVGLHTGRPTRVRCLPAVEGGGIVFIRADRPEDAPVRAVFDAVSDATRAITLGAAAPVRTVEHLLATAAVLGVTDLRVEVDGEELPALDGSALPIADAMRAAGIVDLEGPQSVLRLSGPLYVADGEASMLALPAQELRLTYVVPLRTQALGTQIVDVRARAFPTLLDARTWGYVDDVENLRAAGLARGARRENALGIGSAGYLTPPRGVDEPARHKALDLLGDLSLLGRPLEAHVIAVAAGHRLHLAMVRRILETEAREPRDGTGP